MNNAKQLLTEVCPFCGTHNTTNSVVNLLCECGSKFYIFDGFWLNRKTGVRAELTPADKMLLDEWARNQLADVVT